MENGTYQYDLVMSTPLGKRRGNRITFGGEMKAPLKEINYTAEGTISGGTIALDFYTGQGKYAASGILTAEKLDAQEGGARQNA